MQSETGNFASPTNNNEVMVADFDNVVSETKLAEINAAISPDYSFAESQVRRESIQRYERESHDWIDRCKPRTTEKQVDTGRHAHTTENHTSIESISRQYPEASSSSTATLERFSFVSPQNDPCALQARKALGEMNIAEGSLEKVELRAGAARSAARIQSTEDSISVKAVTSDASSESDAPNGINESHVIVDSDHENAHTDSNVSHSAAAPGRAGQRFVEGRMRVKKSARRRYASNGSERKRRRLS